ncbi:MAG: hypothetical protein A3A86_06560 [Elusimicrobia bacterium RIFCSPLOWO2_01_FULL_60_11]|nr:MAG: hypothetical protein A3A86_06560 [Elusimicrobia bacterium RIFCSPLOWO2_01_FULL_60_11]
MLTLFFLSFAMLTSWGALRSVFEHPATTLARIREGNVWGFRFSQVFCLISLLVVQASLFGAFGTADFSGLSLLLYLVIIWEAVWIALFWGHWATDFLAEHLGVAFGMKLLSAGQGLLILALIVGWLGFGPAAEEFVTGATAQKVLEVGEASPKSFTGHWRFTRTSPSGEKLEESLDVHVSGKDFVIVKKMGKFQEAGIYFGGQLTEVTSIPGAGQRHVSAEGSVPVLIRAKMFWLPTDGLKESADPSSPPGSRPATLFERDQAGAAPGASFKEWVDKETHLVLYRENRFGVQGESLELTGLEVGPVDASVFNPEAY